MRPLWFKYLQVVFFYVFRKYIIWIAAAVRLYGKAFSLCFYAHLNHFCSRLDGPVIFMLGGVTLVVYVRYGTECNRVDVPRETCLHIENAQ